MVIGLLLSLIASFNPLALSQGGSHVFNGVTGILYNEFDVNYTLENDLQGILDFVDLGNNLNNGLEYVDDFNYHGSMRSYDMLHEISIYGNASLATAWGGCYATYYRVDNTGNTWKYSLDGTDYHFNVFMKICLPYGTPINAVEIYNYNGYTACVVGDYSHYNGFLFNNHDDSNKQNWCGIYNGYTSTDLTDSSSVDINHNPSLPLGLFSEYLFALQCPLSNDNYSLKVRLAFFHFDDNNISNGAYQSGYLNGKQDGYNIGYAEARDYYSSHDTSFMSLFGAIADTPIRMIYGLFNFDLLGVSVITIVLTCLTGVVLFGIVKRFIK